MPELAATATPDQLLRQLEWTVIRRLDGLLQGDYRTLWRGAGLDLADLREYQHGDDVRHIDWNVTARLHERPTCAQFTEDRELTAWFLLDLSGSVDFGSATTHQAVGLREASSPCWRGCSRATATASVRCCTAPSRRRHVAAARQPQPRARADPAHAQAPAAPGQRRSRRGAQPPPRVRRCWPDLLQSADHADPRRSMVFVVSDFISAPGWEEPLGRLARRHEVLAVRLYDPLELKLPDVGLVTLEDAESGEQLFVDTNDPAFRQRFEALAAQHEADLRAALGQAQVDTLELATHDDLLESLLRFVALRRQRARASAAARTCRHICAARRPRSRENRTMKFLWPEALWALRCWRRCWWCVLPVAAAPAQEEHGALRQRRAGQAGARQGPELASPRAAGCCWAWRCWC